MRPESSASKLVVVAVTSIVGVCVGASSVLAIWLERTGLSSPRSGIERLYVPSLVLVAVASFFVPLLLSRILRVPVRFVLLGYGILLAIIVAFVGINFAFSA